MTKKEMSELFSVMILAWPNAEIFKGGTQKLGPTITLWTSCTEDVDFWTGQQAVRRLCKINKFPPTIAEFREQVAEFKKDLRYTVCGVFEELKMVDFLGGSLEDYYAGLPESDFRRKVISAMGGVDKLTAPNGLWNYGGFQETFVSLLQNKGLPASSVPMITDGKEKFK